MWALRGLRNGVLTTRWPARPDDYAAGDPRAGDRAAGLDGRRGLRR